MDEASPTESYIILAHPVQMKVRYIMDIASIIVKIWMMVPEMLRLWPRFQNVKLGDTELNKLKTEDVALTYEQEL